MLLAHAQGADLDQLAALFAVARLDGERDGALRRRVLLSLGAHNTAGSAAGYEYWARSVDGAEIVCATRRAPGQVSVVVGGAVSGEGAAALDAQPSLAVYRAVVAQLGRADVRPITDTVSVEALRVTPYVVTAALTLDAGADAASTRAASEASARAYCLSRHRCDPPDNAVYTSALTAALFVPGVASVSLAAPAADVDPPHGHAAWPTAGAVAAYGAAVPAADPVRHAADGVTVTVA